MLEIQKSALSTGKSREESVLREGERMNERGRIRYRKINVHIKDKQSPVDDPFS